MHDLDIVISSNWRINAQRDWLLSHFSAPVIDRIRDVTPLLPGKTREDECLAYVQLHGISVFAAVDDDISHFSTNCPWLALTDRYEGLTSGKASEILALLKR